VASQLEVLIAIGRNGDIYLWGGLYRFGIARILGLQIPTQVVCRHKQWQQFRDTIYNNDLSEDHGDNIMNHPDLKDIFRQRS